MSSSPSATPTAQVVPAKRAAFGIADVKGEVARVLADGSVETLAVGGANLTGLQSVAWQGDGSALVLAGGSVFEVDEDDVSKWADCAGCSGIAPVDGAAVSLRVKEPGLELVSIDGDSGKATAVPVDFVQPIESKALAASGIAPRLVGIDARGRALLAYPAALADTAGGPTVVALHELDGELVDWGQTDGVISSAMLSARGDQVAVLGELWPGTCDSADLLRILTIDESGFFGRIPEFEVSINESHVKYENVRWEGDDLVATVVSHPTQAGGTCQPVKKREEFRAGLGGEMTLTTATASEWYRWGSIGASCEADVERAPKDGAYRVDGAALAVDQIFLPGEESCSEPTSSATPGDPAFDGTEWVLTTSGFGSLVMNQPAPAVLQPKLTAGDTCYGPTLMVPGEGTVEIWTDNGEADGAIEAIVLTDEQAGTRSGVSIGTSLSDLMKTYPDMERPSEAGLEGDATVEFYAIPNGTGTVNVLFEVSDDEVVGVSLQPADSYSSTSDRSC